MSGHKIVWLIAAAVFPGLVPAAESAAAERPNIVFMMVDDLGTEWVSVYGADDVQTPNIDALAATGLRFTNAWSMPQCTPTRVTLLTGQYPFRHGWVNHWDVPRWGAGCHFDPERNLTFARLFQAAGYRTGIAGKWQINDFRVQPGILQEHGFDAWCMWTGYEGGNPPSGERYADPFVVTTHPVGRHGWPRQNVRRTEVSTAGTFPAEFGPDLYNDFVCDFLRRHRDEPMLVYYPMVLTHGPLVATPDEPDVSGPLDRHTAMVDYTDKLVGRVVDTLDELDLRERTIIVFTTDNGTSRGLTGHRNGRAVSGGKARLTENGTCQPFLVNCPGTVPAGVTHALTDFSDVFPTFCDLAGIPLPEGVVLDGRSIAPVILGRTDEGPRKWILSMGFGAARLDEDGVRGVYDYNPRVIRNHRYKIHVDHQRTIHALYDLQSDPFEDANLIDSSQAEHQAALRQLTAVADRLPETDARPRYTPLPPQPWDKQPSAGKRRK